MAYLWDMLDAAQAIMQFIQDRTFDDLISNRMLRNAIERNLEIIGEAARRVSTKTRDGIAEIPWSAIIGLRNIIAHEYGEIRYEKVWHICQDRLPSLITRLKEAGADDVPLTE